MLSKILHISYRAFFLRCEACGSDAALFPVFGTTCERCELDLTAGATAPKLRAALTDEAPAPSSAKRWSDRRAAHSTNQIRKCAYTESNSKMEPIDRKRHAWEALPLVLPLLIVPIVMFLSPRSSCNTGDKLAKT